MVKNTCLIYRSFMFCDHMHCNSKLFYVQVSLLNPGTEDESQIRMDIRCDYDDIAKVCGLRFTNAYEELGQTGNGHLTPGLHPTGVRKILLLQPLRYPHGICIYLIHTRAPCMPKR